MGLYILSFCVVAWFGALALILIKSSKDQGNSYVFDPLAGWINTELVNPARCFRSEIIKPLLKDLVLIARDWNHNVGSKPELNF